MVNNFKEQEQPNKKLVVHKINKPTFWTCISDEETRSDLRLQVQSSDKSVIYFEPVNVVKMILNSTVYRYYFLLLLKRSFSQCQVFD